MKPTPTITALLHTGLFASDYVVGARGPVVYDKGFDWNCLVDMLDRFTLQRPFHHPRTQIRVPSRY